MPQETILSRPNLSTMARKLSEAREAEFTELSGFVDLYAAEAMGMHRGHSAHPAMAFPTISGHFV